jgi:hypothetical protein
VTRQDLPPGTQAVQAAHAAVAFCAVHRVPSESTIVLLKARDELALARLLALAERDGITAVPFREPDLGNALTAVALDSRASRLCRKFPLALSHRGGGEEND